MSTSIQEFSNANKLRCEKAYYPLTNKDRTVWCLNAAASMGKLCKATQNANNEEQPAKEQIYDAIADVVTYLDLYCSRMGGSLEIVLQKRFNAISDKKDSDIKFPTS